mmetsp:Transcript_13261/g.18059  ORF Transcript_13261/g.18059 Transcript_13261/m.18059 type:complete len:80 (+) Transcript_13261:695-934(+)
MLQAPHQQHVETTSTADSIIETHMTEGGSPHEVAEPAWCVTMPSETVLHLDSLPDFCTEFGKVLATNDINESIQVQYAE